MFPKDSTDNRKLDSARVMTSIDSIRHNRKDIWAIIKALMKVVATTVAGDISTHESVHIKIVSGVVM